MTLERRKHERAPVRTNNVAMITTSPPSLSDWSLFSVGIYDISEGGFGFCYSGSKKSTDKPLTLSIFDEETLVRGLPIEIKTDTLVYNEDKIFIRRCGVEFRDLTDGQRQMLQQFMMEC
ncbi:MAG: PilZ domain-containing protein [Desulfobulbaceae bacterium]|nr:PilZ domain-containing protein [Desulfobulbaceae bacterium]